MNLPNRIFPLALLLLCFMPGAPHALASEQFFNCVGIEFGENHLSGERTHSRDSQLNLRLMQKEDKVYLAVAGEAYIEATYQQEVYSFEAVPNVLGKRSLQYQPESGDLSYEALQTRHGIAQSSYHFQGKCQPAP